MTLEKDIEEKEIELKKVVSEAEKVRDELHELREKRLEKSDKYTRIVCPQCAGRGWNQHDKKKKECKYCTGKGYQWAQLWNKDTNY